ncbi:RusA family crossover junction endodeoxyribonuclease [Lacrimispora sphenoides]|uniref:RusA family crossover junction endodeoxyribonuclease n=1 Tax=Lacrimispora sphenoides TaxID=29370 RepID=UPI000B834DF8
MNKLELISPIPPSVNHYLGWRGILKNGKPMAVSYKKPEASKYQKEFAKYVKEQVIKQNWIISDNKYSHYYMDCVFYFPRTDMDANNVFKCLADAITDTGCVWIDDTQLCERVQGIYYDGKNPRIEITICPVDYIGIFNDISQLENFESNCIGCTRYKRNCSILKQAKEGRVQEEIIDGACKKYKKIKGE